MYENYDTWSSLYVEPEIQIFKVIYSLSHGLLECILYCMPTRAFRSASSHYDQKIVELYSSYFRFFSLQNPKDPFLK